MNDPETQAVQLGAVETIRKQVDDLGAALATWHARDDARPCPEARRAANVAMDAVDAALAALHGLRRSLVSEIRASDDARAVRVDELLAKGRVGGQRLSPRGRHAAGSGQPEDELWRRTPDRAGWRAYRRGLVLTVTRLTG